MQGTKFDGMTFSATGSPYAIQRRDAEVYGKPYKDDPAASIALAATMDKVGALQQSRLAAGTLAHPRISAEDPLDT